MGSSSRVLQALASATVKAGRRWGAAGAAILMADERGIARTAATAGTHLLPAILDFEGDLGADLRAVTSDSLAPSSGIYEVGDAATATSGGAIVLFFESESSPAAKDELRAIVEALWMVAEVELAEADRPETRSALGRLASGVAHDFKNVLNPLAIQLQLLARTMKRARAEEAAARVDEAIHEMSAILKRSAQALDKLHELGRAGLEPSRETLAISDIAREALARVSGMNHPGVRETHAPAPRVVGRSADLVSAVSLLLSRAIGAAPSGDEVDLSTGGNDRGAWVSVADRGPSIAEDLRDHVFEPFVLRSAEEPTGLALARVHACARRHGGRVTLTSPRGGGSVFTLWLPAVPAVSAPPGLG